MDQYSYMGNADVNVISSLYETYKENPESLDESWQQFFKGFEFSQAYPEDGFVHESPAVSGGVSDKELGVRDLIQAYRSRGHLEALTNPVRPRKDRQARLKPADFKLTDADLDTKFVAGAEIGLGREATLRQIIARLETIYKGAIGFEYMYVREPEILDWFRQKAEGEFPGYRPSEEIKKRILSKLNEAVTFENFLHTKYLGQKRFSLEGGESTIPALDAIINHGADLGVEEVMIGMAHRGRLNVLAHIMGKNHADIFNEFEGGGVLEVIQGGDVKYHMGFDNKITTPSGKTVKLKLAPNPSHLEAVNPVVAGYVRSKTDSDYANDSNKVLPIIIHGDAAVAGQGIVYEVIQMSSLPGYTNGGTIHFIINNQVGFTTDYEDARSGIYCTDITQIIDSPVLHVNGDDPEAVIFAVRVAIEYRQKFRKDVFIDMVCYRRHGHNESDEPKFTQPELYNIIGKHINPRDLYAAKLLAAKEIPADLPQKLEDELKEKLQILLDEVRSKPRPYRGPQPEAEWQSLRTSKSADFQQSPATGIDEKTVAAVAKSLTELPAGFKPLRQIEKMLAERKTGFFEEKQLNWAMAEQLAYGSVLAEGKIVRLSGQDVGRGTFSHRHAVLRDAKNGAKHTMLKHIGEGQGDFKIFNSLLSEYGVLGFEFGYAMANPDALVIWEAQFGDFANGAQTIIDQFISSSEAKWKRMNGLVMLLPHGYEGQGPEHSNARPERFLQLCAENNMVVANITRPANFFHLMRRQLSWEFRKPCVVMSPKSLLRHPKCVSALDEFTGDSRFIEVIGDDYADTASVTSVLLCTGKIYYELLEKQQADERRDTAIIRMEQLYPFPHKQLKAELVKYPKASLTWVQEEPENMGYRDFIFRKMPNAGLQSIGRRNAASPATGYAKVHKAEQDEILEKAFGNVCEIKTAYLD